MRNLFIVLVALAGMVPAGPAFADAAYDGLSDDAKLIADTVKQETADMKGLCTSGKVDQVVRQATITLAQNQKITGNFVQLGQEAGIYLTGYCQSLFE